MQIQSLSTSGPSTRPSTVFRPEGPVDISIPLAWSRPDTFQSSDDTNPACDTIAPPAAFAGRGGAPRVTEGEAGKGPRTGPEDRRLLTADPWDRARIRPFSTHSPIVAEAQRHLGLPYRSGGHDLKRGADCSGFAWQVYRRNGCHVPLDWFRDDSVDARVHPERLETHGMKHVKTPKPGDVVVFGKSHVGIYAGALDGHPLYIGANHGDDSGRPGRVDIQTVSSYYGMQPTYYRYAPKNTRPTSPSPRSNTVWMASETSPAGTAVAPSKPSSEGRSR